MAKVVLDQSGIDQKLTYDDEVAAIIANTGNVHEEWWWELYDFLRRNATPPKLFPCPRPRPRCCHSTHTHTH